MGCQRAKLNGASLDFAYRQPLDHTRSRSKLEAAPFRRASLHPIGGHAAAKPEGTGAAEGSKERGLQNETATAKGSGNSRRQRRAAKGGKKRKRRQNAAAAEGSKHGKERRGAAKQHERSQVQTNAADQRQQGAAKAARTGKAPKSKEEGGSKGRRKDRNKDFFLEFTFPISRGEPCQGQLRRDRHRHLGGEDRPPPSRYIDLKLAEEGAGGGTYFPEVARTRQPNEQKEHIKHN